MRLEDKRLNRLKVRQKKAKAASEAGLVVQREKNVWAVPSASGVGRTYLVRKREKEKDFECWLQLLEGQEECPGFKFGHICWHIMAVVTDELAKQKLAVSFWFTKEQARRQKKKVYPLRGRNGALLFITTRKEVKKKSKEARN